VSFAILKMTMSASLSGHLGQRFDVAIRILIGLLLLVLSVYGIFHGIRASLAQAIYHYVKYGAGSKVVEDLRATFRRCQDSFRLYPYGYYLCIWTAEKAYYGRFGPNGKEVPERLEAARLWCERGLELNYYKSQLRRLKTRLLARESLPDAIEYWGKYVDWQFWEPYNHAVLVEMYAEAGDLNNALESLVWVEGSEYYEEASRKFDEAWKKEMVPP